MSQIGTAMIIEYLSMSLLDLNLCQSLIFAEKQKSVNPLALIGSSLTECSLKSAGPTL